MTAVKIKGVRTLRVKGNISRYHRKPRTPIDIDLDAYPELFLAKVRELDELAAGISMLQVQKRRGELLGDMFDG